MVDFNLPLSNRENANLIYAISYVFTLLVTALIWSIWRFIKSILSFKPNNIKLQVENRLAQHYSEHHRYRQNQQRKFQSDQKIVEVESQQNQQQKQKLSSETKKRKKTAKKEDEKAEIKNVENE